MTVEVRPLVRTRACRTAQHGSCPIPTECECSCGHEAPSVKEDARAPEPTEDARAPEPTMERPRQTAGPVRIRRPDGTVEVQPPYDFARLNEIITDPWTRKGRRKRVVEIAIRQNRREGLG